MKPGIGFNKRKFKSRVGLICLAFLLFAVLFCCGFSSTASAGEYVQPEQIILTWTVDPATSQTITWLMPGDGPARVQYAVEEDFDDGFDAAWQSIAVGVPFAGDAYRYTATITGLSPDTQYVYRVGRDGAWSEPLSFSTSPAGPENFTFLYLGDVQSGYAQWGNMLEQIYSENPQLKFALLGGDLTDKGHDPEEWGEFLAAATGLFSRISMMPTMGNHDGIMYLNFFALPDNGPTNLKQEFYSFDYGNAHFVVLNSSKNTSAAVKQWLQEDLQNTMKKWKFAVFHHPAYPAVADYKGIDESIRINWIPILEQYQVDMVFVGHQHVYMRTHPIFQREVQSDAYGIVYVMGNSGSKIYGQGEGFPYIARMETGSNYQVIEIEGDALTLTAKKDSNELIENYTINKKEEPVPLTYTVTFAVRDGENAIEGAAIEVQDNEGRVVPPKADGTYELEAGDYSYTVTKEGYRDAAGIFTVADNDVTVTVTLEAVVKEGKAALQQKINEALALAEGGYTPAKWKVLNSSLRIAQVILNLEHATQTSVNQALARLTTALAQLVEKPDRTVLETAINTARALNPADYTPRFWRRVSNALTVAVRVFQNENATQDDVNRAAERLNTALDALVGS